MATITLLLDAAFLILTATIYAYVGRVTLRRHVGGEGQLAATLFGIWWFALAVLQANGALNRAIAAFGALELAFFTTTTYVGMLVLSVALWALVYYLFYLLTGSRRVLLPITAFYILFYAALLYLIAYREPIGIEETAWRVALEYRHEVAKPALTGLVLALILPPLVGAIGYARLFFRVDDPTQRYRIGLVSATIGGWFGTVLVAWMVELSAQPWWQLVSRSIGLLAALLIYTAYHPPGWVRRRYGIEAVDEKAAA